MHTLTLSSFIQTSFIHTGDLLELTLAHPSQKDKLFFVATSIICVDSDSFTVSLPSQMQSLWGDLEQDQEIKCIIPKNKSIWSFRTRLIEVTHEGGCLMKLALPTDSTQVQRRKHVRIHHETDVQVDFFPEGFSLTEGEMKTLLLKSLNISPVGIKLLAPFQLANESLVRLTFNLDHPKQGESFQKTHTVLAKVVYSFCPKDIPSTKPILIHKDLESRQHIVAFRFLELTEAEEKGLFEACLHLESHKKSSDYTSRLEIQSLI